MRRAARNSAQENFSCSNSVCCPKNGADIFQAANIIADDIKILHYNNLKLLITNPNSYPRNLAALRQKTILSVKISKYSITGQKLASILSVRVIFFFTLSIFNLLSRAA